METKRECGGCTACCKPFPIPSFKAENEWCKHCMIGRGCEIYQSRPRDCSSFKCTWIMGIGGEKYRPDRIGFVPFYRDFPGVGITMFFGEVDSGALDSDFVRSWTRRNLENGVCVLHYPISNDPKLYLSRNKRVVFKTLVMDPSGKIVDLIKYKPGIP